MALGGRDDVDNSKRDLLIRGRASERHMARPGKGCRARRLAGMVGLVPQIKDVAGRFAAQGYLTLIPDLYHGKSTLEAAEAST